MYHKKLVSSPFVIGAHHSFGKSSLTAKDLLADFIEECKKIMETGITHGSRTIQVKLRAVICDAPARAFLTATKGHIGFHSCRRCVQKGLQRNRRIILDDLNCDLRTDASFQRRGDIC